NGGDSTLIGDSMNFDGTAVIAANAASTVTLRPKTNGTAIDLGGADGPGTLGLTDTELDRVSAGTLAIGDTLSGPTTVTRDLTRPAATTLRLPSGKDILTSGGQVNTGGGSLLLHPGASPAAVRPLHAGIDATASTTSFASDLAINIAGTTVDLGYDQLKVTGT